MKKSLLLKTFLIAAALPLFTGCVTREVVYRDRPPREVVVEAPAPPPLRDEVVVIAPSPDPRWYWVPGCWEWRGRWVWAGGHWARRPHNHAVWVGSHWGWHGSARIWIGGGWH